MPGLTGGRGTSVPGIGLLWSERILLTMTCMRPTKRTKITGVRNWHRFVRHDRHCSVRSFKNYRHNKELVSVSPHMYDSGTPLLIRGYTTLLCIEKCPHFTELNRRVPLYTEVSSFQGVGIEEFYCIQRCPHFRGLE